MHKFWGALIVVAAVVAGAVNTASAQPCHGKIISIGDTKWEVQEACGEPSSIEETIEVVPKLVYDAIQHVYVQIPVYINKSIWTYNFGPTSLIYILTFREHKLDKIETGGYGR
jgi:Protein of unknown function (DUF2845)